MTLNFPDKPDLPLGNSPLREVICQIRFTPLLEIVQKLPAAFQSQVRQEFPNFEITQNIAIESSQPLPGEYVFKSPNEKSRIALGINLVAFSTQEYSHWANFEKTMKTAFDALKNSYGPIFTSRIGLRYINELNTKNTNTKSIEEILGILNDDLTHLVFNSAWSTPKKSSHQLSLEDNGNELTLRMVFEKAPNPTLLLDFDYFVSYNPPQEIDLEGIADNLGAFHKNCYNAFRWCIREERLNVFATTTD